MPGSPPGDTPPETLPSDPIAAYRRMEQRVAAGGPPGTDDLLTPWEEYRAAVLLAGPASDVRLPSDVVAEFRADHEALVRVLKRRADALRRAGPPLPIADEDGRP